MKKFYLLLLLLVAVVSGYAQNRSETEAMAIASSFFNCHATNSVNAAVMPERVQVGFGDNGIKRSSSIIDQAPAFYIFNNSDNAFVIVSGDERMPEVLGYSDSGAFSNENIPDNVKNWLEYYEDAYAALKSGKLKCEQNVLASSDFASSVSPLLGDIAYDQDSPYNRQCPEYNGQNCYTGCVATALASIMRYYKYPEKGSGQHSYVTDTHKLSCSFDFGNTTFDWDNMLETYTGYESSTEINAVATLMKACGVAVDMDYTTYASGAISYLIPERISTYMGYNANMTLLQRNYYQSSEWISMLKNELNEKRPVFYNGSSSSGGHAFVIDGYDEDGMFHLNWGWGGYYNGYFELLTLSPDGSGIGGGTDLDGYRYSQGMIVNFRPEETEYAGSYMYADRMRLSKEDNVKKGEKLTLTVTNLFNFGTLIDGSIAVVLDNGTEISTLLYSDIELNMLEGWNNLPLDFSIPSNCADGIYKVYIATKDKRETSWSKVRCLAGEVQEFYVEVSGDNCSFYADINEMSYLRADYKIKNTLVSGNKGEFEVTLSNEGSKEFYGELTLMLLTEDMSKVAATFTNEVFSVDGGSSKVVNFSVDLLTYNSNGYPVDIPAGNYVLTLARQSSDLLYPINDNCGVTIIDDTQLQGAYLDLSEFGFTEHGVVAGNDFHLDGIIKNIGKSRFNGTCTLAIMGDGVVAQNSTGVVISAGGTYDATKLTIGTGDVEPGNYYLAIQLKDNSGIEYNFSENVTVVAPGAADVFVYSGGPDKDSYSEGDKILFSGQAKAVGTGSYEGYYTVCIYDNEGSLVKNSYPKYIKVDAGSVADINMELSTYAMSVGNYSFTVCFSNSEDYFVAKRNYTISVEAGTPVEIALVEPEMSSTEAALGDKLTFTVSMQNKGTGTFDGYIAGSFVSDNSILQSFGKVNKVIRGGQTESITMEVPVMDLEPGINKFAFLVAYSADEQYYSYYTCDINVNNGEVSVGELQEEVAPVICSAPNEENIRLLTGISIDNVVVYSETGQVVGQVAFDGRTGELVVPAAGIRNGVYIVEAVSSDGSRYVLKTLRR